MVLILKGEPLVHKLAMVAKWVVYPGVFVAAYVYAPPNYNHPNKSIAAAASSD
ncbi:unnamed protein product [Amaranthus hypochondriacus]